MTATDAALAIPRALLWAMEQIAALAEWLERFVSEWFGAEPHDEWGPLTFDELTLVVDAAIAQAKRNAEAAMAAEWELN